MCRLVTNGSIEPDVSKCLSIATLALDASAFLENGSGSLYKTLESETTVDFLCD